jgi:uncharacterized membrane protein YgdD (TMEM256/DUF423 family)
MKIKQTIGWAGFLGATSVTVLALAAHALESKLDPSQLNAVKNAGQIQLFHAVALLAISAISLKFNEIFDKSARLMIYGTCMFSFSIYLIMLKNAAGLEFLRFLWPVTPIGGLVIIVSWILVLIQSRSIGNK